MEIVPSVDSTDLQTLRQVTIFEFEMTVSRIFILLVIMLATSQSVKAATILVMGDSLSAAHGIELEQGWVNLLQIRLHEHESEEKSWQVVNASVSGETTAGGLKRLPDLLTKYKPQLCIIELGANDGLRGMSMNNMQTNLNTMIGQCKRYGQVLLLGMQLPPNYGKKYTGEFKDSFELLAKQNEIAFVPFLLKGFAKDRRLFLADGFHPNAEAQGKILENVWPIIYLLLIK